MEDQLKEHYQSFAQVLSDGELKRLAAQFDVVDQRERRLPIRIFFWLMVLSASQPGVRSCLFQLVAFFVAALTSLFATDSVLELSKMAVSKKLKATNWRFFHAVFVALLERYQQLLPGSERRLLAHFQEAYAIDGSVARVHAALKKLFASVHPEQAALKLNTKFSVKNLAPHEIEVSAGKRHDSRYTGVTNDAGVLYLFDLGYWAFRLFERICAAGSFFVSRLKANCDPLIVAVTQPAWAHLIGKRLSEVLPLMGEHSELDVTVQLSKAKHPRLPALRLVGLLHEGAWRCWVTNIVDPAFTPQLIFDLYRQRWLIEIVFTQMTKGRLFAGWCGWDHIADFNFGIVNDNPINQQLYQLSALGERELSQRGLQAPTKVFDTGGELGGVQLLLGLHLQLPQLLSQAALRLGYLLPLTLKLVPTDHLGQIDLEQAILLAL